MSYKESLAGIHKQLYRKDTSLVTVKCSVWLNKCITPYTYNSVVTVRRNLHKESSLDFKSNALTT